MTARTHVSDKRILAALKQTGGRLFLAAELLNCDHRHVCRRAKYAPRVAREVEFYQGRSRDLLEAIVLSSALEGESWAIRSALLLPEPTVDVRTKSKKEKFQHPADIIRELYNNPKYRDQFLGAILPGQQTNQDDRRQKPISG